MKKLFLLLIVPIICMSVVGCSSTRISHAPDNTYKNLAIKDLQYNKNTRTITFKTENKGNEDITTGLPYTIEKYNKKNKWEKTNLTDKLAFIDIALIIQPGKTIDERIDLSMVNITENGKYRIVKAYNVGKENINQYIEFEVNGSIGDLNSYNSVMP